MKGSVQRKEEFRYEYRKEKVCRRCGEKSLMYRMQKTCDKCLGIVRDELGRRIK